MFGMGAAVSADERLERDEARAVLRRAARMATPFRRTVLAALGFIAVSTSATVVGPLLVRYGIDTGIGDGDAGALDLSVVLYVVIAIVAYLGGRQQHVFVNRAGEGFLRVLRIRVFDHIQRQSLAFFDRNKSGVLVSRMTADIESLAELVQWGVLQFVAAAILLTFSLVVLFVLSWQLTLVALMVMPIIIVASIKFQRDSNAAYLEVRERVGQNLSALQEGISGVRVIQAYTREPEQRRRFRTSNRALYDSHLHSVRVSTWYFGLVEFCGVLATALAIGAGGWLVHRGDLSVGTVVAVVLLLASLFEPVQQLSQLYNTVQSATASLHKLFTILDTEPAVDEHVDAIRLPERGDLVVDGVTFAYPGTSAAALVDVSLRVGAGERLALVGPTGAGKSTVAKLMARLYDPDHGTVCFGDVDLRDATLASLRERIVVVPQEGFLFDGTIADNLRIARPGASDDDVRAALDAIGVLERFEAFPEGLATAVRERGSRLSAGERQLVSLARAALVDPAVLVLDEATSNLDPGTEAVVEGALERLMRGRSVVVVAHRLSTVRRADRIAVVDHGRIAEVGTHDELIATGGRYALLAAAWERTQVAPG
ncbi:MAG TPA: ABC transporter ATP-binding protein [Ilumatobacteraceae bacterium]|nr:ABC transporter ATP-binding protein [Ilumatobacteraceae bacterium]